eukprot:COSAG02_NODE_28901_length_580_cov_0.638254_2_plen_20_part_01
MLVDRVEKLLPLEEASDVLC